MYTFIKQVYINSGLLTGFLFTSLEKWDCHHSKYVSFVLLC